MTTEFIDRLDAFRQISQLKLVKILDSIGGNLDLVIDGSLMKPLERFIGVSSLRAHGVQKIYKLDTKDVVPSSGKVAYLARANLLTVKRICDQVSATGTSRQNHLIAVPMIFQSIDTLVEESGLYGTIHLHSLQWELISLDTRVFSFEHPEIFKHCFISKDDTYLGPCARTIWSLQHIVGKAPISLFIGARAKSIQTMMTVFDEELGEPEHLNADLGLLLVVDRDVDYASVLLTPGTYTSLLADVIGISTGAVRSPKDSGKSTQNTMLLNSDDKTYSEIKHKHFSDVTNFLKQKISEFFTEKNKRNTMTIQEMQEFVKNDLNKLASAGKILALHLNLCEEIMNKIGKQFEGIQACQHDILLNESRRKSIAFIEDIMATGGDMSQVLRLICLLSLSQNGFSPQEATTLKLQFLHAYGHEHLVTFYNLEKLGLFSVIVADPAARLASKVVQAVTMPRKNAFQATVAMLKLIPDASPDYCVKNPRDPGYVFGGIYVPLLVQLVHSIIKKEKPLKDLLKCLPGNLSNATILGKTSDAIPEINPRCIWVYIVGGITYAEIAAFDLIEKKTGCRIVCSGSSIINGNSLVQSATQ